MPHPQCVFSHNPDHGSLFPVAKKKLAGKPQRFEEQKKGLIAPMKDLKIMADDLNVPTQGGRVFSCGKTHRGEAKQFVEVTSPIVKQAARRGWGAPVHLVTQIGTRMSGSEPQRDRSLR
jgi:hypothetical protein